MTDKIRIVKESIPSQKPSNKGAVTPHKPAAGEGRGGRPEDRSNRSLAVWGIGPDDRVYLFNGTSWTEPNPVARARQISAATQGGAWALGPDGRVYWSIDGTHWAEPDPTARMSQISGNLNAAWAVGKGSNVHLYNCFNQGVGWSTASFPNTIKQVSCGNIDNVWAVAADGRVYKYDTTTNVWHEPNPVARAEQISAMSNDGAWAIGANKRVFVSIDGLSWQEPNPAAGCNQISAADDQLAWGVGDNSRVFRTSNGGLHWLEPNPSAGLRQVSVQ